jgi:nicotinate-nucleotide pyrophosphorylase (carboxylating)
MNISPVGSRAVNKLIDMALDEDIGPGDITTDYLISPAQSGRGFVTAKEPLVICGLEVARDVFLRLDPGIRFQTPFAEGERIQRGARVIEVAGPLRVLLTGERTALNFLQRLSGIATCVRGYVDLLGSRPVRLVDTRKTAPGWRVLEKYAVRVGGACNHRTGLFDGVLIKDNHIAAAGGISVAVKRVRGAVSHLARIEVEVADLDQVEEALAAGVDVIMLDNMDLDTILKAVAVIGGRAVVEVSGGVTRESLERLADTGVDLISVGALTHSATSVDLSMQIVADSP